MVRENCPGKGQLGYILKSTASLSHIVEIRVTSPCVHCPNPYPVSQPQCPFRLVQMKYVSSELAADLTGGNYFLVCYVFYI